MLRQIFIVKLKNDFDEKEILQTIINEEIDEKKLKEKRWRTKRFVSADMKAQQTWRERTQRRKFRSFNNHR